MLKQITVLSILFLYFQLSQVKGKGLKELFKASLKWHLQNSNSRTSLFLISIGNQSDQSVYLSIHLSVNESIQRGEIDSFLGWSPGGKASQGPLQGLQQPVQACLQRLPHAQRPLGHRVGTFFLNNTF